MSLGFIPKNKFISILNNNIKIKLFIKFIIKEGQRKSNYEENEAEKKQNSDLIDTLKKEIRIRLQELAQAREIVGEEEAQVKKYINDVCPIGNKSSEQVST